MSCVRSSSAFSLSPSLNENKESADIVKASDDSDKGVPDKLDERSLSSIKSDEVSGDENGSDDNGGGGDGDGDGDDDDDDCNSSDTEFGATFGRSGSLNDGAARDTDCIHRACCNSERSNVLGSRAVEAAAHAAFSCNADSELFTECCGANRCGGTT